jgi:hypothetical protein
MATRIWLTMVMTILMVSTSFAAHPLITDDTGTQGKGNFLLEVNSEFIYDKEREEGVRMKETGGEIATLFSYGITDNIDIVLGLPYQWFKIKEEGEVISNEDGLSDFSVELKWGFFEKDSLSLALKPGITLPTGNEKKGLGNGRPSYALTFITTKEIGPWAIHLNLGHTRNEYKLREDKEDNRKDIWHASLASEVEVMKNLKAVANVGIERNSEKESNRHPAFILGGVIYTLLENFDIDFGIKRGMNKPEADYAILAGIALRF